MGLLKKLKGELVDIIEWLDDTPDTMVYRFERYNNEIKYGAKLVVRESQNAVFINMGKLADVFQPGTYELETNNLPILSSLKGWKHGFQSPFKAEVYFVNTRRFTDLKWGTKNPIMLRDAEFGPVRLRAFGTYTMRITDSVKFIKEIVGTDGSFTKDEITDQLRNIIVAKFSDAIGESKIPALDLAANYDELAELMSEHIGKDFTGYGLELDKLLIGNISLPPEVEKMLDKRTSMGVLGDMNKYSQFQAANSMEAAAKNPGGTAAGGMGMGMGFAMANQMGKAMNPPEKPKGSTPPPLPAESAYFLAIDGQQTGPLTISAIKQKISGGKISLKTKAWKEGMAEWTEINRIEELKSLFGATPPPLPPE